MERTRIRSHLSGFLSLFLILLSAVESAQAACPNPIPWDEDPISWDESLVQYSNVFEPVTDYPVLVVSQADLESWLTGDEAVRQVAPEVLEYGRELTVRANRPDAVGLLIDVMGPETLGGDDIIAVVPTDAVLNEDGLLEAREFYMVALHFESPVEAEWIGLPYFVRSGEVSRDVLPSCCDSQGDGDEIRCGGLGPGEGPVCGGPATDCPIPLSPADIGINQDFVSSVDQLEAGGCESRIDQAA